VTDRQGCFPLLKKEGEKEEDKGSKQNRGKRKDPGVQTRGQRGIGETDSLNETNRKRKKKVVTYLHTAKGSIYKAPGLRGRKTKLLEAHVLRVLLWYRRLSK